MAAIKPGRCRCSNDCPWQCADSGSSQCTAKAVHIFTPGLRNVQFRGGQEQGVNVKIAQEFNGLHHLGQIGLDATAASN